MRVLLVEDDAILGDALRRTLSAAGYAARLVGSGAEALAALVDEPDVVLLDVDLDRRVVTAGGEAVALTRKEFDLLAALARREGAVIERAELLEQVWGTVDASAARTLEAHVASLRSKLGAREVVTTVRGVGYRLAR